MELKEHFHFYSNTEATAREIGGGGLFTSGLANLLALVVISLVVILPL
ncbi:hypothetical protein KGY63_04335 [Candidatus Bipolaricaulota bacterium]|nr:hypothetical protein [Candidatus Bipolaricaulota bacterium]